MWNLAGMDIDRALVRLSLFGSAIWLLFWSWRYATGCIRMDARAMFCPNASGETLVKTDNFHIALFLLLPPLCGFLISAFIVRRQRQ
jgi:hypothetical protein